MKKAFRENLHLGKANIKRLEEVNKIIEKYHQQGYKLTLRQLYYQLVSKNIIPNKVNEYGKLSSLVVKGRMAGVIDWEGIEDRLRVPKLPYWVFDIPDAVKDTINNYRLNRQQGQEKYIEVWCEKDALSNVLYRLTSKYHLRLMVNRGYSSCTAMHDAFNRFKRNVDQERHILYLGDHDPSGLDMIRDIQDRLDEFGIDVDITPVALTKEQINQYNPPPNPAKITDPRSGWYIEQHGNTSWEVDALPPEVLHEILIREIESRMDMDLYESIIRQEQTDKRKLQDFANKMKDENKEDEGDEQES